jgi:hypothetical protein
MDTVTERVARGVALLDERNPGWWRTDAPVAAYIEPEILDIGSCGRCVLAQLYGSYFLGSRSLGLTGVVSRAERGFARTDGPSFADLTTEWKRVITGRRAAA